MDKFFNKKLWVIYIFLVPILWITFLFDLRSFNFTLQSFLVVLILYFLLSISIIKYNKIIKDKQLKLSKSSLVPAILYTIGFFVLVFFSLMVYVEKLFSGRYPAGVEFIVMFGLLCFFIIFYLAIFVTVISEMINAKKNNN